METEVIVSIIAAVLALFSLAVSIFTYCAGLKRERKQATIEAYNTLQEEVLDKLQGYTPKQVENIAKDSRSQEYKELGVLLARCQHFAVGVNTRIYDLKTLRRLSGSHLGYIYDKLLPVVEKKRSFGKGEGRYMELENLVRSLGWKPNEEKENASEESR